MTAWQQPAAAQININNSGTKRDLQFVFVSSHRRRRLSTLYDVMCHGPRKNNNIVMLVWAGMGALICTLSEFVPNQPQILVLFLRIPAKMYLFGLRDFQKCDDESTNSNPRRSHVGTCRSDCHLDFVFPLSSTSFPRKVPILNSFAAFLTSQHLLRSYQATPYNSQRPLQQTVIFCCHSTLSVCILAEQRWQYEFVPNWSSSVRIRTQGNHRRYEFVPKGSS